MSKFTELSAKDINEVNGGRISPIKIGTGPIVSPYISAILFGAVSGVVGAVLKK